MAVARAHRSGASSCLRQPGKSVPRARYSAREGIRCSSGDRGWTCPYRSPVIGRKFAFSAAEPLWDWLLAFLADRVLLRIYLPADAVAEFHVSPIPDVRVLAFAAGVMLLTSLVFGLLPAVRSSRTEITLSLGDRSGALSAGSISLRRIWLPFRWPCRCCCSWALASLFVPCATWKMWDRVFQPITFLLSQPSHAERILLRGNQILV